MFIRHDGSINCAISGYHRYSRDLPQDGLEVPCWLCFTGTPSEVKKVMFYFGQKTSSGNNIKMVSPEVLIKYDVKKTCSSETKVTPMKVSVAPDMAGVRMICEDDPTQTKAKIV